MSSWFSVAFGVLDDARARQRRRHHRVAVGVVAAAAVGLVIVLGDGPGAHRRATSPPRQAPVPPSVRLVACTPPRGKGAELLDKPSEALLSVLAVLRRPATPADVLPARVERAFLSGPRMSIYVRYVRRARVINGISYYVFPALITRCQGQLPYDGIWVWATHVPAGHGDYGGAGFGGAGAKQIAQGSAVGGGPPGSSTSNTITMVVPDGVAHVTLHFPAGPANGFHKNIISPAATVTTSPVGNVVAVRVPRSGGTDERATMTWRAADGHTIKTFNRL